jgi:hypothetical protein
MHRVVWKVDSQDAGHASTRTHLTINRPNPRVHPAAYLRGMSSTRHSVLANARWLRWPRCCLVPAGAACPGIATACLLLLLSLLLLLLLLRLPQQWLHVVAQHVQQGLAGGVEGGVPRLGVRRHDCNTGPGNMG